MGSNLQHVLRSRSNHESRQCRRQSRRTVLASIFPCDAHIGCIDLRSRLCTTYLVVSVRYGLRNGVWVYMGSRLILYCRFDLQTSVSSVTSPLCNSEQTALTDLRPPFPMHLPFFSPWRLFHYRMFRTVDILPSSLRAKAQLPSIFYI